MDHNLKIKSIKSSFKISSAKVSEGNYLGRPAAYNLFYTYTIDSISYKNLNSEISIHRDYIAYFLGKEFPVIYSTKHPKRSMLLVFPENFEYWGLPFPDSLQWVIKYHDVY